MYNFITIEGCIGAGKTTLTKMLAKHFACNPVFENFEDNPYLKNFYADPDKNAFPLELYFMAERYQQQSKLLDKINLFESKIISDYAFFKSLVFANITLKGDELQLYKMLFHIIYPNIKAPDIILYLHKPNDLLLENIKKRGRDYEQDIKSDYLQALNQTYLDFFKQQTKSKVIILDSSNLDFVKKEEDFEKIIDIFSAEYDKKINYL
ncbi:MAG: deoxynucleoside kinase [Chitinophagales bacterium]|nr:deoxynucleoside kinase [Bacteroidota bacterium]MCB9256241.1 deoxynucleoside kinase [Chitinophagales bacterium]